MKKLAASAVLVAVLLKADFQPSRWKYRRPLPVEAGAKIAVLNADRSLYLNSQPGLGDLRVVSGAGEEIPYVIEKMSGSRQRQELSTRVADQGVVSSGNLEVTLDVGEDHRHNGIRISTPRTNFRQRVRISTSDDGRAWQRVRDDGYIFDFQQDDRHVSVLYVGYPVSTRRYARVTIFGWN